MFSTTQLVCHTSIGQILLKADGCICTPRYVACESAEKDNDSTGATDY